MAEQEAVAKWSLKDTLIVIPSLASALALTWEVGYFVRIRGGAFGLFSIAEHLTFALQALPIALAMSMVGVTGLVSERISKSVVVRSQPALKLQRILNRYRSLTILVSIAAGVPLAMWYFGAPLDFALIVLAAVGLVPYWFVTFAPRQLLLNPAIICGGVLVVLLVALGIGFQSARDQILSRLPLTKIKVGEKGKDTETEVSVRIMRTGERGVLYFDPVAQTFGLLPWDYVKRVDWAISPLRSR